MATKLDKYILHDDKAYTNTQTDAVVLQPDTNKRLLIHGYTVGTSAAATIRLSLGSDAVGNRLVNFPFAANSGESRWFGRPIRGGRNQRLLLSTSTVTGTISVVVYYTEEA